ncbi:MAG: MarR family transcriptional regulator [Acidobacteria bacterium]|nr:MarR family transcriptional regulator [Acidobacteriota bacterium]
MDAEGEYSTAQVSMMNMISANPLRVGDIARRLGIRLPSATEMVIKLQRAGLVERLPDATDARAVLVSLTGRGQAVLAEANVRRNEHLAEQLGQLDDDERAVLEAAIPVMLKLNLSPGDEPAIIHAK